VDLQRYQRGLPAVETQLELPGGLPPVRGHEAQLRHLLLSLISNAKQAMAELAQPELRLLAASESGMVRMVVEDIGPGLPAAVAADPFRPFGHGVGGRLGIGLAVARLNRGVLIKVIAPLVGLGVAIFTHAFHNTVASLLGGVAIFVGFIFDWSGWLAMFVFILFMVNREKRWMEQYLRDEVALGTLSQRQYRAAISPLERFAAILDAMRGGGGAATGRFYQLLAELAHKKRQLTTLGEEGGNSSAVTALRAELSGLTARAFPQG